MAADSGNASIVQALLTVGAKVDQRNARDGSMAVHLAARYELFFLSLGADARPYASLSHTLTHPSHTSC